MRTPCLSRNAAVQSRRRDPRNTGNVDLEVTTGA